MTSVKFGVWGGSAPGGWCCIQTANGWMHWGTADEAHNFAQKLMLEYGPTVTYEVVLFDPKREPPASTETPSKAMLEGLALCGRGQLHGCNAVRKPTRMALFDRGWIFGFVNPDGRDKTVRLTTAGRALINSTTHDQIIFGAGRLLGLSQRLRQGGTLDAEEIQFLSTFANQVLDNEKAWALALKEQEEVAAPGGDPPGLVGLTPRLREVWEKPDDEEEGGGVGGCP